MVRNHRFLSINSHEVKRDMEGVLEKFKLSNFSDVADKLQASYEHVINDPICMDHYEVDAQFSIVSVLLELAHNPIQLFKNKIQAGEPIYLDVEVLPVIQEHKEESDKLLDELREDFVALDNEDNDSVLSVSSCLLEIIKCNYNNIFVGLVWVR